MEIAYILFEVLIGMAILFTLFVEWVWSLIDDVDDRLMYLEKRLDNQDKINDMFKVKKKYKE